MDMFNFVNRMRSFGTNWSNPHVKPKDLAAAGLYFTGIEDRCQCFHCGGVLGNWVRGDIPIREHIRHFPDCGHVDWYQHNWERLNMPRPHLDSAIDEGEDEDAKELRIIMEALKKDVSLQPLIEKALKEKHSKVPYERFQNVEELMEDVARLG